MLVIFAVAGVMTLLLYPPNPAKSVSAGQPDRDPRFQRPPSTANSLGDRILK
jgi:hypothetical protein